MRDLGYLEDRDITIELRFAEGAVARLPELAAELVSSHQDHSLAARHPHPCGLRFSGVRHRGWFDVPCVEPLPNVYRQKATMVDKILKEASPGELPIERTTKFEWVINLKAAKLLGLEILPMLLARADEVIE